MRSAKFEPVKCVSVRSYIRGDRTAAHYEFITPAKPGLPPIFQFGELNEFKLGEVYYLTIVTAKEMDEYALAKFQEKGKPHV